MQHIIAEDLEALSELARGAERRRKNLNLHPSHDDPVQRFLNALEPGTYVRPHRHADPGRWELLVHLRGRAVVLAFDGEGVVVERRELSSAAPVIEIPAGTWHTVAALESGTVLFEVKQGPYVPATPGEFAPWAPTEGSAETGVLEQWFRDARTGECAERQRIERL
jgi:cupin fold WbuC family metalloprotein